LQQFAFVGEVHADKRAGAHRDTHDNDLYRLVGQLKRRIDDVT
jgi:hypothetical protein